MSQQISSKDILFDFAEILTQQTDFHEVLRLVAHQSAQFLRADLALVLMVNPDTRETIKTVVKEGKYTNPDEYSEVHINIGGWIIHHQKSFLSDRSS